MIELLYFVKVSLVVLTAALALAVVGRKASAASRHLLCTLAITGLLALPILSWVLPGWSPVRVPASLPVVDQINLEQDATTGFSEVVGHDVTTATGHYVKAQLPTDAVDPLSTSASMPFMAALTWLVSSGTFWILLYVSGALLLTVRVLIDRFAVRRLARHATELCDPVWQTLFRECANQLGVHGHVRLLRSLELATPMAIGIRDRAIVVPPLADAWPDQMRRAVLLHELAHVARRDCLTQTAAAFACALYWVHPGSWWLARRLRIERELACDDLVLSAGTDAGDYAGHLLELAYTLRGHVAPALAVGMATPHQLEARMLALLDRARNRTAPSRLRSAAACGIVIALMLPIATATAVTTEPADDVAKVAQAQEAREVGAEMLRRFLTVEYWRQTASVQLSRLAEQLNYLSEMRQLGYSVANVDVLFKLRQHGVTPEFVRALAAEGLSGLSTDDLLTAVSHGISANYVRDLKSQGYQPLDIEVLTRLRNHGIDGEFIRELSAVGFARLSIDDLVRARSYGISPEYIRELHALGYQRLSLDQLVLLRSHGVESEYIRELQRLGYGDLTTDSLAALRSHGVTSAHVQSANTRTATRLSVEQLTELASHGWKP